MHLTVYSITRSYMPQLDDQIQWSLVLIVHVFLVHLEFLLLRPVNLLNLIHPGYLLLLL